MSFHGELPSDGFVRIPVAALATLTFSHLLSDIDCSIAVPADAYRGGDSDLITGLTEWVGAWKDDPVTIGWDWAETRGLIVMLNPAEIRTNVLICDGSRATSHLLTRIYLLEKIETLPWTTTAIPQLLAAYKAGRQNST
jgi:hypothetical protein